MQVSARVTLNMHVRGISRLALIAPARVGYMSKGIKEN